MTDGGTGSSALGIAIDVAHGAYSARVRFTVTVKGGGRRDEEEREGDEAGWWSRMSVRLII